MLGEDLEDVEVHKRHYDKYRYYSGNVIGAIDDKRREGRNVEHQNEKENGHQREHRPTVRKVILQGKVVAEND